MEQTTATFNCMPCIAHTIQLCIKAALSSARISPVLTSVRKTSKCYRKSMVGWEYLRKQKLTVNSKRVCRPLLDVPTRWGSTLAMLQRFLHLRIHINSATAKIFRDKVKLGQLQPCIPLTSAGAEQIESIV